MNPAWIELAKRKYFEGSDSSSKRLSTDKAQRALTAATRGDLYRSSDIQHVQLIPNDFDEDPLLKSALDKLEQAFDSHPKGP